MSEQYRKMVDDALASFLQKQGDSDMYKHMEYFLGFRDEQLNKTKVQSGKRFRPLLSLMLADDFGDCNRALAAAASIELFHNFSLIHDDIVDQDELRRGRKTVWRVFGRNQALNSGDAQLLLASRILLEDTSLSIELLLRIQKYLLEIYQEVAEGQHLDFQLTDAALSDKSVDEAMYLTMITKKTAVLIGGAAAVAGLVHEQDQKAVIQLYEYGVALGLGYQLQDDYASLWAAEEQTGKEAYGDIWQKKKTLPVLHAYKNLSQTDQQMLNDLYQPAHELSEENVQTVMQLVNQVDAKNYLQQKITQKKELLESLRDDLNISKSANSYLQKLESRLLST